MNELEIVDRLRRLCSPSKNLTLGIGDDCAIYRPRAGEELLFTTDQMIEGVHFTRAQSAGVGAKLERYRGDGRRSAILSGGAGRVRYEMD